MKRQSYWLVIGLLLAGGCDAGTNTVRISSGTGFIVGSEGYIITNNHVIKNCADYRAYGTNIRTQIELVDRDSDLDLALFKLPSPAKGATFSTLSTPLKAWDQLAIIGYPGTAGRSHKPVMTRASLLFLHGPRGEDGFVQFSDSVEQGNSGGPLLDAAGNVVGVVLAKSTTTHINNGIWATRTVEHTDIAITLDTVEKFLGKNHIQYDTAESSENMTDAKILGKSKAFIVNVQCTVQ